MSDRFESSPPEATTPVTLHLPPDLARAIDRLCSRSGQSQSQVLLNVLRRGLTRKSSPVSPELQQIADGLQPGFTHRLTALETLPQRMEALEGKSIAS